MWSTALLNILSAILSERKLSLFLFEGKTEVYRGYCVCFFDEFYASDRPTRHIGIGATFLLLICVSCWAQQTQEIQNWWVNSDTVKVHVRVCNTNSCS